jgi:hypothetical protein
VDTKRATEGPADVLDSASRSPTERNAVDMPGSAAASAVLACFSAQIRLILQSENCSKLALKFRYFYTNDPLRSQIFGAIVMCIGKRFLPGRNRQVCRAFIRALESGNSVAAGTWDAVTELAVALNKKRYRYLASTRRCQGPPKSRSRSRLLTLTCIVHHIRKKNGIYFSRNAVSPQPSLALSRKRNNPLARGQYC